MASNSRDFELELKLKTEWSNAQRTIEQTKGQMDSLSASVLKANQEMASAVSSSGVGGGSSNAGSAAAEQAAARMVAATRASQDAVQREMALIGELDARLGRHATSLDDIAATEA